MSFTFTNQMEENTEFSLAYPFHIHKDKLLVEMHPMMPDCQIANSFEQVLRKAYKEPFAVYLTDEDKIAYSAQEIELFARVVKMEQDRVNNGMCVIDLTITSDNMERLLAYKKLRNCTFEEALQEILQTIASLSHDNISRKE